MIPISIWVVEDNPTYRRMLQQLLNREEHITCSRVFPSCIEFLEAVETEAHPELVLMDLGLPEMGGVEGIKKMYSLTSDITVIVLTTFKDKQKVLQALEAGAAGYLLKTATGAEILKGIQDVFMGETALSPAVARIVLEEMRKPVAVEEFKLTDREVEVLEQLALDRSPKEVANNLGITVRTTRFHLSNIYEKLNVTSQTGAVAKALRTGII
jgi:DNA-binding NarL/FixJ family response regulator